MLAPENKDDYYIQQLYFRFKWKRRRRMQIIVVDLDKLHETEQREIETSGGVRFWWKPAFISRSYQANEEASFMPLLTRDG